MLRSSKHVVRGRNGERVGSHALVEASIDLYRNELLSQIINLSPHLSDLSLQLLYVVFFFLNYLAHQLD